VTSQPGDLSFDVPRHAAKMAGVWLLGYSGIKTDSENWTRSGALGARLLKIARHKGRPALVTVQLNRSIVRWLVRHLPASGSILTDVIVDGASAVRLEAARALRRRPGRPKGRVGVSRRAYFRRRSDEKKLVADERLRIARYMRRHPRISTILSEENVE
jgi:hypothetical protein